MKRFRLWMWLAVLMAAGTLALAEGESESFSSDGEGLRRGGNEGGGMIVHLINNPRMAEKLDLTDEQKESLQKVADEFKSRRKTIQDQLQGTMMNQAELLTAETVDENAIYSAIDKAFEMRRDMAKLQIKTLLEAKRILTPEQITIIQTLREEFKKNRSSTREERKNKRTEHQSETNDVPSDAAAKE